jgi:hypothetical protein
MEIAERVERGELTYSQGERLAMFLDLERLGLAKRYYPKSAYADRRRLATKLGYSANETGTEALDVDLGALLSTYVTAVDAASGPPRGPSGREAAGPAGTEEAPLVDGSPCVGTGIAQSLFALD